MTSTVHDSGYKRLFGNKTIFRQLIETFKDVRQLMLPAMFALVLYNGDDKWTAPDSIEQLTEREIDLGEYALHFKHLVIAENEFSKESLLGIRNIVSTLFLTEAHYDFKTLRDELLNLCDTEEDVQALELFLNWLRQLAVHGQIASADFAQMEEQYRTREEMKSMFVKALEREREMILQEGIDIGKKEGIDIGKKEGIDIGKKEGIDIGKKEGVDIGYELGIEERNRQIVRAMTENGFTPAMIAQILTLSLQEVERLLVDAEPEALEPKDESVAQPVASDDSTQSAQ